MDYGAGGMTQLWGGLQQPTGLPRNTTHYRLMGMRRKSGEVC